LTVGNKLNGRFGRKKTLCSPRSSHSLCRRSFPVTEIFSSYWIASERKLRRDTNPAKTFLLNGRAPHTGEIFRNPELASISQTNRQPWP